MKKIKSVRLTREYKGTTNILFANQYATKIPDCGGVAFWEFKTSKGSQYLFSEETIRNNHTNLFEIEYEQERKYIDVRIECNSNYTLPNEDTLGYVIIKEWCMQNANLKVRKLGEGTL